MRRSLFSAGTDTMPRSDTLTRQRSNASLTVKERYLCAPAGCLTAPLLFGVILTGFVFSLFCGCTETICISPVEGVGGENRGGEAPGAAAEEGRRQETDS